MHGLSKQTHITSTHINIRVHAYHNKTMKIKTNKKTNKQTKQKYNVYMSYMYMSYRQSKQTH